MLRIFTSWKKIHRPQSGVNPRTLDLEARTLPRDHWDRLMTLLVTQSKGLNSQNFDRKYKIEKIRHSVKSMIWKRTRRHLESRNKKSETCVKYCIGSRYPSFTSYSVEKSQMYGGVWRFTAGKWGKRIYVERIGVDGDFPATVYDRRTRILYLETQ